jgi:hypothetical protein
MGTVVNDTNSKPVADAFLFRDGEGLVFFEIESLSTRQGELAYAVRQEDGSFVYGGIVIDEPPHLSYPQVFKHEGS